MRAFRQLPRSRKLLKKNEEMRAVMVRIVARGADRFKAQGEIVPGGEPERLISYDG